MIVVKKLLFWGVYSVYEKYQGSATFGRISKELNDNKDLVSQIIIYLITS